jgi:thiamine transport system ATP-binding protein
MLRVNGAVVRFDEQAALDGVDLEVDANETVAVLGPSGSGKTTLLRAIAGLQRLDEGRVSWNGTDLRGVPSHERRFGLVFQEYALFPHRDVAGNVEFGLRMAGLPKRERVARVDQVLGTVGLAELRARKVGSLSGGEQQRVALARALAVSPRLLMFDEPLGALDRVWRTRLVSEIRALVAAEQLPAVYVTHDHDEAFTVASRVVVMRAGRVVQQGAPREIWSAPVDAWTAHFLGFARGVDGVVRAGVLESPWCEMPGPRGRGDGPVAIVLRPDAVRLDAIGEIAAVVDQVVFRGSSVEVAATPDVGPQLMFAVAARAAPREGARIALTIDPAGVLVYDRAPE